ncbi:ATP-binding protein [Streptomyces sp. NPDC000229]|uniref:ATP-binding protein n=1 Tax=Streptomyces sp. NPDC000229 TaxID=3154247 RepID=UPI004037A725
MNRPHYPDHPTVSPQAVGAAQLVVSELVTNACKYVPGPCAVDLEVDGPALQITVWDTDPALPVARAAEPGRIGQHGLEIVMALCEGFDVQREPVGKRIGVRLALTTGD